MRFGGFGFNPRYLKFCCFQHFLDGHRIALGLDIQPLQFLALELGNARFKILSAGVFQLGSD